MSEQNQPVFNIEKIYVRDLSLEVPNAPQVFLDRDPPQVDMQLHNQANMVEEGIYESILTITVTAKLNDKTVFLVEVSQAGIFQIRNIPEEELDPILGIGCPNIIFPFARETVADIVTRAGFPPVLMAPINFEAMYQQRLAEQSGNATH